MIDKLLKDSLEQNLIITIIYQKGERFSKRNIRVLDIRGDKIKAYCFLREQIRIFKRSSILSAGQ